MADGDLSFDVVDARAEVSVSSFDVSAHPADGGAYSVIRVRGEGPVSSSDPRLEGTFKADAVMLVNARGEGVGRDDWEIVDADNGETKATGVAHAIHNDPKFQHDPQPFEALSIGRLADGTRFFTNAKVTLPAPGTDGRIVIEYGGLTEPANRALAVVGRCEGLLEGG